MSRICDLTAVKVQHGNNVSHSERKTKRTFKPNLHKKRLFSYILGTSFRLRITPRALKAIEFKGGFDSYMLKSRNSSLSAKALKIKKQIESKLPAQTI
jgi:large subunit ribosomal protein L28